MNLTFIVCFASYFLIGFYWSFFAISDYYYRGQKLTFFWETFNFGVNMLFFPIGVLSGKFAYFNSTIDGDLIRYSFLVHAIGRSIFNVTEEDLKRLEGLEDTENDKNRE